MAYEDFKYLARRTASDEILHDKAFNIAKNPKYDGCQRGLASMVQKFIRTLKNKIYKYRTSISKNVYIGKLDDTVNKYINIYHSAIKLKPVDVKPSK